MVWVVSQQMDQDPMAVNAAVPIEAAVERGVQLFRGEDILWPSHDLARFIRIFPVDTG